MYLEVIFERKKKWSYKTGYLLKYVCLEVIFERKKKWSYKTGYLLKYLNFIRNFVSQDNKKVTF